MRFKAYKVFERDKTISGFQYEKGKTYTKDAIPVLFGNGFLFYKDLVLSLPGLIIKNEITENLYAEVEILGDVAFDEPTRHFGTTNRFKIIKFLTDEKVLSMVDSNYNSGRDNSGYGNSGDYNSGDYNSGDGNTGNHNSGCYNAGNYNSGHFNVGWHNSGSWNFGSSNSGNYNTGCHNVGNWNKSFCNIGNFNSMDFDSMGFCSIDFEYIYAFNKKCSKSVWDDVDFPNFLYFQLLKGKTYKESFIASYNIARKEDKKKVLKLPNFDKDVFFEISGIDVSDIM